MNMTGWIRRHNPVVVYNEKNIIVLDMSDNFRYTSG